MNPRMVELALKKQRLQFRAESERAGMIHRLAGIDAALDTVDHVRDQLRWARDKAPLLSLLAVALLLIRPRATLKLARRGWFAWLLLRRGRHGLASWVAPLAVPVLRRALASLRRALDRSTTTA